MDKDLKNNPENKGTAEDKTKNKTGPPPIKFVIEKTKRLEEITFGDIPPGLTATDIALEE